MAHLQLRADQSSDGRILTRLSRRPLVREGTHSALHSRRSGYRAEGRKTLSAPRWHELSGRRSRGAASIQHGDWCNALHRGLTVPACRGVDDPLSREVRTSLNLVPFGSRRSPTRLSPRTVKCHVPFGIAHVTALLARANRQPRTPISSSLPLTIFRASNETLSPAPTRVTRYTTTSSLHGEGRTRHRDVPRHVPTAAGGVWDCATRAARASERITTGHSRLTSACCSERIDSLTG